VENTTSVNFYVNNFYAKIKNSQVVVRQPKKIMKERDFYTTSEVAGILKISKQSVLKRIHRDSIKAQKMGRDFIILKKNVDFKKLIAEIKR